MEQQNESLEFFIQSKDTLLQAFCNLQVTYGEQKHEIRNLKQTITRLENELCTAKDQIPPELAVCQSNLKAAEQERDAEKAKVHKFREALISGLVAEHFKP